MFSINDTVMYGNSGVCTIVDIRPEKMAGKKMTYYILKPAENENMTIYCPVDSDKIKMRSLLSLEEVNRLISIMPDTGVEWIEDDQQRKEAFTGIVKGGDQQQLVKLIKTLYAMRQEKLDAGKKFHAADEKIMKDAEDMLYGEFSSVLNIRRDEVIPFIMGELEKAGADEAAQPAASDGAD